MTGAMVVALGLALLLAGCTLSRQGPRWCGEWAEPPVFLPIEGGPRP